MFIYKDDEEERRKEEKKLFVQLPWSNLEVPIAYADDDVCELLVVVELVELLSHIFFSFFVLKSF
jgi:hypothetical protein